MHVVGLRHANAGGALAAGALKVGAKVNFRHKYVSAEHPDAYAAYCSRFKIGFMPRFGSRLLKAAGFSSPVTSEIRSVSGVGNSLAVVVEVESPFQTSPPECFLTRPTVDGRGVYAIINVLNMKAYIGSTENFDLRRRQHLQLLERGTHFSPNLQHDWQKNPSAFAFVVVDVNPPDLARKEQHRKYISSTENPAFGYNQGSGFSPTVQQRPSVTPYPSSTSHQSASRPHAKFPTTTTYAGAGVNATPAISSESHQYQSRPTPPVNQSGGCLIAVAIGLGFLAAVLEAGMLIAGLVP